MRERRIPVLLLDLFLPLILFLAFFAIKAIGAGDIKLFMVTGIFLGSRTNLICIGLALLLSAVFGLVRLIQGHNLLSRIETLLLYGRELFRHLKYKGGGTIPYLTKERLDPISKIHLSLPILLGAVASVFLIS
jgi:prepilin peptidase CpaA